MKYLINRLIRSSSLKYVIELTEFPEKFELSEMKNFLQQ